MDFPSSRAQPEPRPKPQSQPEPQSKPAGQSPSAGLCDTCRHQQIVRNTRGSVFSLCRRSKDEPDRYPRYPRVPVLSCPGYEPSSGAPTDPGAGPATGTAAD